MLSPTLKPATTLPICISTCQCLTCVFWDQHGAETGGASQTEETGHAFPPPSPAQQDNNSAVQALTKTPYSALCLF